VQLITVSEKLESGATSTETVLTNSGGKPSGPHVNFGLIFFVALIRAAGLKTTSLRLTLSGTLFNL
jgi:hypothetical protein